MLHSARRNIEDAFCFDRWSMTSVFCLLLTDKKQKHVCITTKNSRDAFARRALPTTSCLCLFGCRVHEKEGRENETAFLSLLSHPLSSRRSSRTANKCASSKEHAMRKYRWRRKRTISNAYAADQEMTQHTSSSSQLIGLKDASWSNFPLKNRSCHFNRFFKSHESSVSNRTTGEKDIHYLRHCVLREIRITTSIEGRREGFFFQYETAREKKEEKIVKANSRTATSTDNNIVCVERKETSFRL